MHQHLEYCIQFWSPHLKDDTEQAKEVKKDDRRWEREESSQTRLFSLEEKTAKGLRYGSALESHEWCEKVNGEGTITMSYNRTTQERIKIIRQQI